MMLTTLFTLVDLVDHFLGSLEVTAATETYTTSIKLQDEGVYTVFFAQGYLFSCSASKPKHHLYMSV